MKVIILAVLVACAAAAPAPLEEGVDISPSANVQVLVNGVPEGHALDIDHILGIELNEQTADTVVSSNVLQPLSPAAVAEAAATPQEIAALPEQNSVDEDTVPVPAPIELPEAVAPEVVEPLPEPVELPEAPAPEVVETPVPELVLPEAPAPEVVETPAPAPILLPEPVAPEVVVPEVIPEHVDTPVSGDVYNDGLVQVTINTPEDQGILNTLSSWMSIAISYVTGGVQTTNQIV